VAALLFNTLTLALRCALLAPSIGSLGAQGVWRSDFWHLFLLFAFRSGQIALRSAPMAGSERGSLELCENVASKADRPRVLLESAVVLMGRSS
jgi:hypothetical protein